MKGRGFSRAARLPVWISALAAAGIRRVERDFPRGLKPKFFDAPATARLKPRPFKALPPTSAWTALFALALVLVPGTTPDCHAQLATQSLTDPSAQQLAQRVDRHYNQLHSLKAGFTESYEGLGMQRTESGTLLLVKPGRMRWDYSSPPGKLFLLDGKYAWFYSKGDPQVQRMESKQLDDLRSPLRFLLGHTELEKEMVSLTLAPAAAGQFTLSGVPKGQERRVSRLTLTVTADGVITAIEIEESDGAITRFTFTNEAPNAPIPADAFRFTAPRGVPVVDAAAPV